MDTQASKQPAAFTIREHWYITP